MPFTSPILPVGRRLWERVKTWWNDRPVNNGYGYPSPPLTITEGLRQSLLLVIEWSSRHDVDGSHNQEHSKEVLFWLIQILETTPEERRENSTMITAMHGAILHDVLDEKYMCAVAIHKYRDLLLVHLHRVLPDPLDASFLLRVMEGISYRKVVQKDGSVRFPEWIPEEGKWYNIYHWIREADLLASYNIARMVEYRTRDVPRDETREVWQMVVRDVMDLYHRRIARLVERGLFVHPEARKIAEPLAYVASLKATLLSSSAITSEHYTQQLDILRIVHHLRWSFLRSRVRKVMTLDPVPSSVDEDKTMDPPFLSEVE